MPLNGRVTRLELSGGAVEVIVLEADRKKKQIRPSRKGAQAVEVEEETAEPPPATAMEIALRKAMEQNAPEAAAPAKTAAQPKARRGQEDLLARTLEQRAKTTAGK